MSSFLRRFITSWGSVRGDLTEGRPHKKAECGLSPRQLIQVTAAFCCWNPRAAGQQAAHYASFTSAGRMTAFRQSPIHCGGIPKARPHSSRVAAVRPPITAAETVPLHNSEPHCPAPARGSDPTTPACRPPRPRDAARRAAAPASTARPSCWRIASAGPATWWSARSAHGRHGTPRHRYRLSHDEPT